MAATRRAPGRHLRNTAWTFPKPGLRPASRSCCARPTSTSSRLRRPITCTPDRRWPPPSQASTSCSRSRPPSTSRSSCRFATPFDGPTCAPSSPSSCATTRISRSPGGSVRKAGWDEFGLPARNIYRTSPIGMADGTGSARAKAVAATCSRQAVTPSTHCGGAPASSQWR